MILCSNPKAQYLSYKSEIDDAISRVLDSGWYILGNEVRVFEEEFASYIGVSYGIGVGSGTEALHIALRACDIGTGDEVITVSHTAVATVAAIELAGAIPVLVDIEPEYYTLDPAKLETAISSLTKAIIPVHLYGQPADLTHIIDIAQRHNIRVIEDCSQAHGAMYSGQHVGAWGHVACFSFYPTKNLGAIGDGGIIVTNDSTVAERARLLSEYGWAERYVSHITGLNSRLDELQAAILRVKLRYLDGDIEKRTQLASLYNNEFAGTDFVVPSCRPESMHVYHLYVLRSQRRNVLQAYLKSQGIESLIHYPVPVHMQPAYQGRLRGSKNLHETVRVACEVLSLPMYSELNQNDIRYIIKKVKEFV